ncbi:MAG: TerC family protein [Prevotellaceae bacterium]|jgi:predicted tellurium resistance membrane protein TerC|nr:TerC family protein [Prevotellaceae bacterium]
MEAAQILLMPSAWLALITLVLLEVVLGIDNIVFLSIMTSKLPAHRQPQARVVGLVLAMLARMLLLLGISLLARLTQPLYTLEAGWLHLSITGQSLIILSGGLFLLYKSVTEIHHKIEDVAEVSGAPAKRSSFALIIAQIVMLDIIFSLDSVLTAVGMVSVSDFGAHGALAIMVLAVAVAVAIMLLFSGQVSRFVNQHPSVQMLALSFLILIGVTLIIEAGHLSHLSILGREVSEVPKGYIYFAIAFSLLVEMLNLKLSRKKQQNGKP